MMAEFLGHQILVAVLVNDYLVTYTTTKKKGPMQ